MAISGNRARILTAAVLLVALLWPRIVAGLSWLTEVLAVTLAWTAGGTAALGVTGAVYSFVIAPLLERRADDKEAEQARRDYQARSTPQPLPRPNWAPPPPHPNRPIPLEPAATGEPGGQPSNPPPRQPDSERRPHWADTSEAS